jgi:hypothetical protein
MSEEQSYNNDDEKDHDQKRRGRKKTRFDNNSIEHSAVPESKSDTEDNTKDDRKRGRGFDRKKGKTLKDQRESKNSHSAIAGEATMEDTREERDDKKREEMKKKGGIFDRLEDSKTSGLTA